MTGETVLVNGEPVENVLVEPGEGAEGGEPSAPAGPVAAYTLRFPDTFEGPLENALVTVRGVECRTIGRADHYRPRGVFGPSWALSWDMTVRVERASCDLRAEVAVFATASAPDSAGRPARTRTLVWEGAAQARRAQGDDSVELMPDGSRRPVETWSFVVPWQQAFSGLRSGAAVVEMNGAAYCVTSVEDLEGRGEFASIEAVRRG